MIGRPSVTLAAMPSRVRNPSPARKRMVAKRRNPDVRDAYQLDVRRVLDTRTMEDGYEIGGIGIVYNGALETFHVTDKPQSILRAVKRRTNVVAAYGPKGAHAELGPGLYLSGVPQFWMGRASGKWSFLDTLSASKTGQLVDALAERVDEDRANGRLTRNEVSRADRTLDGVRSGSYGASALLELAGQPYGIAFWRPSFLQPLGIEPGAPPSIVEVNVVGRFAELNRSMPSAKLLRAMRKSGLQGAFTRMSMGSNAELVLWDSRAVRSARVLPQR
jgi:hypothetical protein